MLQGFEGPTYGCGSLLGLRGELYLFGVGCWGKLEGLKLRAFHATINPEPQVQGLGFRVQGSGFRV